MIVLSKSEEIDQISVIEDGLLTECPSFSQWQKRINSLYRDLLKQSSKFEYRHYQPKYAAMTCLRPENIHTYSQGVGKTTITGLVIAALYSNGIERTGQIHIAVPNALAASRWLEDLYQIKCLRGKFEYVKSETQLLTSISPILIYRHDFPKLTSRKRKSTSRPFISRLLTKEFRPNFLVVDEIHELGNPNTQRYKHLYYVRQRAGRVLGLTGTLSDGRLDMIHHICSFVYRQHWDYFNRKVDFVKRFAERHQSNSHYLTGVQEGESNRYLQSLNWEALEEYYQLMRRFVHRLRIDEPEVKSCITLPIPTTNSIAVEPSLEQKERYASYIKEYFSLLNAAANATSPQQRMRTLSLIHPLIQISNAHSELEVIPKAQELLALVERYSKVAVFVSGIEPSRYVTTLLQQKFGESVVVRLYAQDTKAHPAKLSDEQRCNVVYEFQRNPQVRVGVFSLNLASVSIDLTSADALVHYETGWSSLKLLQSISRVIRPGNINKQVPHYYLYNKGLIDEHQFTLLHEKLEISQMLLDYQDGDIEPEDISSGADVNPNQALSNLLGEYRS